MKLSTRLVVAAIFTTSANMLIGLVIGADVGLGWGSIPLSVVAGTVTGHLLSPIYHQLLRMKN